MRERATECRDEGSVGVWVCACVCECVRACGLWQVPNPSQPCVWHVPHSSLDLSHPTALHFSQPNNPPPTGRPLTHADTPR